MGHCAYPLVLPGEILAAWRKWVWERRLGELAGCYTARTARRRRRRGILAGGATDHDQAMALAVSPADCADGSGVGFAPVRIGDFARRRCPGRANDIPAGAVHAGRGSAAIYRPRGSRSPGVAGGQARTR